MDFNLLILFVQEQHGGHQWLIEFEKPPVNIDIFSSELDKNLKNINSDYAIKRTNNLILRKPEVICLEKNMFYKWLKKNQRLGGQYKIPRLCNDRVIAEEILSMTQKFSTNLLAEV